MPIGLQGGAATIQRLMDKVLQSESQFALAYIDDITMFSHTWEAHRTDLQSVLQRLREAGLTVNVKKEAILDANV